MDRKIVNELKKKAEELIAVPHCYQDLKDIAKKWVDSIGTAEEKETAKKFVEELKEDVLSIDDLIGFTKTDIAKEKFGEEGAKNMHDAAVKAKADGEKYCICAACKKGGEILDMAKYLLD